MKTYLAKDPNTGVLYRYIRTNEQPYTVTIDYRLLMAGEYSTFDLYQQYDEEAFGVEPPNEEMVL